MKTDTLKEIIGRSVTLSRDGETDAAVRRWRLIRADGTDGAIPDPSTLAGLPKLGDAFTTGSDLILSQWNITENADDGSIDYEAQYSPKPDNEEQTGGESGETQRTVRVESRGWRGTSYDAPICYDAVTGEAVLLPTGEPFENVPSAPRAGMTFYITYLAREKSGAMTANCTLNQSAIEIDGVHIPIRCGKLSCSEEEIAAADSEYKYRTSIEVEVRHNYVRLKPGGSEEDIGHDVALLLQGYRYIGPLLDRYGNTTGTEGLVPFMESDGKGGSKPATTPGFLDDTGRKLDNPSPSNCYFMRVHAIREAAWNTNWFVGSNLPPPDTDGDTQQ